MQPTHEHFSKFADYLSIDTYEPRLVIILAASKNKIVRVVDPQLDEEGIRRFTDAYERGQLKKYGITDPITSNSEL